MENFNNNELYVLKIGKVDYSKFRERILLFAGKRNGFYDIARKDEETNIFRSIFSDQTYRLFITTPYDYLETHMSDFYVDNYWLLFTRCSIQNPTKQDLLNYRNKLNGVKGKNQFSDVILQQILEAKSKIPFDMPVEQQEEILSELSNISDTYFKFRLSILSGKSSATNNEENTESYAYLTEFIKKISDVSNKIDLYIDRNRFNKQLIQK